MNPRRRRIATDLLERSRAHDAAQADRLDRYRNLKPETAELLHVLVIATAPSRVLELGTSNGYSALWLGDACEQIGASLTSVDADAGRLEEARAVLASAELDVELREADAGDVLREPGPWDLVFLDSERPAYADYWPDLLRVLPPGGLLAIDNVLSHPDQVVEVTALIEAEPSVLTSLVPIGAGLRLVVKRR